MNLTVRAEQQPLWLCFEPWATEHTLLVGTAVVIRFADGTPVEVTHLRDGMIFFSLGSHPDLYAEDGTALEIYSEWMPDTPTEVSAEMYRALLGVMPPIRSDPDARN